MRREYGDLPVSSLRLKNIEKLMALRSDRPAAVNTLLKMMKILMKLAVKLEWRSDNPAIGIDKFESDSEGYLTWPEEEIERFEAFWTTGSVQRLAFDLLLHTGQRSGDVRRMGRQHLSPSMDVIIIRAQKTRRHNKVPLHIPITAQLQKSLSFVGEDQLLFVTHNSQPYTAGGFGNMVSLAARKAGVPPGYSPHGLRKAAAVRLAEAGCSEAEIMSITGHKSPQEVQRYIRAANQKKMAKNAQQKVASMRADHQSDGDDPG